MQGCDEHMQSDCCADSKEPRQWQRQIHNCVSPLSGHVRQIDLQSCVSAAEPSERTIDVHITHTDTQLIVAVVARCHLASALVITPWSPCTGELTRPQRHSHRTMMLWPVLQGSALIVLGLLAWAFNVAKRLKYRHIAGPRPAPLLGNLLQVTSPPPHPRFSACSYCVEACTAFKVA